MPSSCHLLVVNVNWALSITPIQSHLIQLLSEGGQRLEGMLINPQVNTSVIRSVTLQHCPRGMCEFHLESSQMGDNSSDQAPSGSGILVQKRAYFEMQAQFSQDWGK